jgi:hypothetical protein
MIRYYGRQESLTGIAFWPAPGRCHIHPEQAQAKTRVSTSVFSGTNP